jgi:hypothetical protein
MTSIEMSIDTRFHCEFCQVFRRVRVRALGQGTTNAFQSAETGEQRAKEDAKKHAEQTLLFLACPECGKAPRKGEQLRTRWLLSHLLGPVAFITLASAIYGSVKDMDGDGMVLLVGISAACGLFAGGMTYLTRPKPWQDVTERVKILAAKRRND